MILRIARHTNNIAAIKHFYVTILNLTFLGEFNNHNGYDGIFIGKKNADWHLEFTTSNESVKHQFDEDDLLVLYPKNKNEYEDLVNQIKINNIALVKPKNPYWEENGITIVDPDGFRVVISSQQIK